MESMVSKINNFIGNNIYDNDSDDEYILDDTIEDINDIDQSTDFFGFFKKNIYEFGRTKKQKKTRKKKKARIETDRNKIADSIKGSDSTEYNYSRLIRFTKKDPTTGVVSDDVQNDPNSSQHRYAITKYGAFILYASIEKHYNDKSIDITNVNGFSIFNDVKDKLESQAYISKNISYQRNKSEPSYEKINGSHPTYESYRASDGGGYELDSKLQEGDKDGYVWIEARGPDNPPRLRYYKIMLFADDKVNTDLMGNSDDTWSGEQQDYPGGWKWYHQQGPGDPNLAVEFNRMGLHIDRSRNDTSIEFWNTPGRVAAETWFPPIKTQTPTEAGNGGGSSGNKTTFLNTYAIQQASYTNQHVDKGVDTPDLFSNNLQWTLVSSDDIDAAMIAADDAEFDAELAAEALSAKQEKMHDAMSQLFATNPLRRLKSMFLYDNLLTIHLGKENDDAGMNGKIINPHISNNIVKPSFYKTITHVTPNHSDVMRNFIEDVKDRTIYICSNVLLGISFCFLPYIKFPVLDALVHTLAYKSSNNQATYDISRMPLTAKFTALFLSLQTSLITTLKTNASPLCAVIGLSIIAMTLPTIHFKPGKKDMDNVKQAWEGLASLNVIYMIIALFPPMAPNATLEEALYSMFFPPGGEFDKVLEKIVPLLFMILLQSTLATSFLILNIWFICMVPAICLLLFPLFRTMARYVGGSEGNKAAALIDTITDQLVEPSVNQKDGDTGLSMMDIVTKVILVLAIFFILAEFFDAVNDHFGLSNVITKMVNSFRSITTLIPEILLVFFIVMSFSKAIKSVGAFNEQASATAKWDNETRQKLDDGKNPAYAMLEYIFGALQDATLLSLGTITGKQDAYEAKKEKEAKEAEAEIDKEIKAIEVAAENKRTMAQHTTDLTKIESEKKVAMNMAEIKREEVKGNLIRIRSMEPRARRREAFEEKQRKVKQDYELKRLQVAAKNDIAIGEKQIEMAMLLGSGSNLGVPPIKIKQMMRGDSAFKAQMENAISSGQDVTKVIQNKIGNVMMSMPKAAADTTTGTTIDTPAGTTTDTTAGTTTDTPAGTITDTPAGTTTDTPAGTITDTPAGTTADPTADPTTGTTADPTRES